MVGALILALQLAAGQVPQLAPGTTYDPKIPTLVKVLGHDFGERITTPEEIPVFLRALNQAAPDRTMLVEYARSYEDRPLWLFVIAAPERIAALERFKADRRRLADPRGLSTADADRLLRDLPIVTWLMHGVHGNEISSSDAALAEAFHLLAATGDADVQTILRNSIVIIDPMQNPDGRARFIAQNLLGSAAQPDPNPDSAEHDEPWPGGRSNHYLFDMNRDWFSQSQPETRGRIRAMLDWYPQVVVDLHEMGGDSTYFFPPVASPINPHITKAQTSALELFGRANAAKFDERGFAYFIRENYDGFYPGYGDSWPVFHGAVGMTYEQASARGLVFTRTDDQTLTYRDGIVHHFTAAMTTMATAAKNRERLMRDFYEFRRTAIEEGEHGDVRDYVIVPGVDPSRALRLARNLATQGIEVRRADESVRIGARTIPSGAYLVSSAQPAGRLVSNLLDPQTDQDAAFVKEQDRRRKLRLSDEIYDITAWSLPLLYDVEVLPSASHVGVESTPLITDPPAARAALPPARVAYLLPWGSETAAAVGEALRAGIHVRHAGRPMTINGRRFPIGTAIVRVSENGPDLATRLGAIVAKHEVEAVATDTGYQEDGISLGSANVMALRAPRVVLAWDLPTQSQSAGWARFVLERRFGQPVSAIRVSALGRIDWSQVDVLVLPSGTYAPLAAEDVLRRIREWIRDGGTLVTIAEASRWAAGERINLLETRTELKGGRPELEERPASASGAAASSSGGSGNAGGTSGTSSGGNSANNPPPFDYDKSIQPERERPENVPGGIVRVKIDQEHWLSSGQDASLHVLIEGQRVFTPIRLDKGRNVGVYESKDALIASGLVWDDARDQLAQKAYLVHEPVGRGHVIAFAEDPNYRAFTEASELLFINAVLLGPAY